MDPKEALELLDSSEGWIGVIFEGTLSQPLAIDAPLYSLGAPIESGIAVVKSMLSKGFKVQIISQYISPYCWRRKEHRDRTLSRQAFEEWCLEYIGEYVFCTNSINDETQAIFLNDQIVRI